MRYLIAGLLVILAAALYFTSGLRFGMLTLTPLHAVNAQGHAQYAYRLDGTSSQVQLVGDCTGKSGRAVLRLTDPGGRQVAGQECVKGTWSLNLVGDSDPGYYHLSVDYDHFTGEINLISEK